MHIIQKDFIIFDFSKGRAKVALGLATGKKNYDKRQALAEKAAKRDVERALKERQKY